MAQSAQQKPLWQQFNERAQAEGWPVACDADLDFTHSRLGDLLLIWQAAKGRRAIPRRADITTRMLKQHLPDVLILDRVQALGEVRRYRIRFHGSHVARISGDGLGKFLDEVIPAAFVPSWYFAYDTVLSLRIALRFTSGFAMPSGEILQAESMVAPLGDGMGNPASLLCSTVYAPAEGAR